MDSGSVAVNVEATDALTQFASSGICSVDGAAGATDWSEGLRVHRSWNHLINLFKKRVALNQECVATICGDTRLSYSQLWSASDAIAGELVRIGVTRGDVVAILLPRGVSFLVAALGTLKVGAAYMPIDERDQETHTAEVVKNTSAAAAITTSGLRGKLPRALPVHLIDREVDPTREAVAFVPPAYSGDDMACVINTIGSAGEPQSVGVRHQSFANLIDWYMETLSLRERDRVLVVGLTTSDTIQKNLFAPLLVGGVVVFPESESSDAEQLARLIKFHRISFINGTPSCFCPIVDGPARRDPSLLESLRWVVLTGEALETQRLMPWLNGPGRNARVLYTYGPAECTDLCAAYEFGPGSSSRVVPIGRALDNVRLAIVDRAGRHVGPNKQGELVVGGAGVGIGYLGRGDLTATAFPVSDLFGAPQRVFWTGDIVKLGVDGLLEFVSRKEQQIKSVRVPNEYSEVEETLRRLPQVQEATVLRRPERTGSAPVLIAFLVAAEGRRLDTDTVRRELASEHPKHKVPSRFVFKDALPRDSRGLVDRCALSELALDCEPNGCEPAAPERLESLEDRVAQIWATILGQDNIDRDQNFFDAGGTSFGVARMQAALADAVGRAVPVVTVLANPTIRRLADALGGRKPPAAGAGQVTRIAQSMSETGRRADAGVRPRGRLAAMRAVRRAR